MVNEWQTIALQWESIFNLLFHSETAKRDFFLLNLSKMINLEMKKEIENENKPKVHVDQAAYLLHFAKNIYQIHWKWKRNKFGVKLVLFLISFQKPFSIHSTDDDLLQFGTLLLFIEYQIDLLMLAKIRKNNKIYNQLFPQFAVIKICATVNIEFRKKSKLRCAGLMQVINNIDVNDNVHHSVWLAFPL